MTHVIDSSAAILDIYTPINDAGLDPAGPLFENRDWTCGLNPSSADLVDVIHTNGEPGVVLNLGTLKVLGHVDFYPNGGGRQPDCLLDPFKGADSNGGYKRGVQDAEKYGKLSTLYCKELLSDIRAEKW